MFRRFFPLLIPSLAVALSACGPSEKTPAGPRHDAAVPVSTIEAQRVPWERRIALVGALLPNQQARISAEVEGGIEQTYAEVGDTVTADQPLAQIDSASYKGQVNLYTANVAKAEASAQNQQENLDRLGQLKKTGAVSTTDFDQVVAAQKQANAEVAAAKAQLGSAQTALRRSLAKAPFAGAITERLVNTGDFVRIGTVMFQIVDDSVLKFRAEVPEREAARVKTGGLVRLKVDAYPDRIFEGTVSWINPAANADTRSVGIEARVENSERLLKANFFARAEVITETASPALIVPVEAIVSFAGVTKVFIVEKDTAQPREVILGGSRGEEQEILGGLTGGERIIVGGRTKVQTGSKVTPAQ